MSNLVILRHNDSNCTFVELRSSCSSQHLHDLEVGVFFAAGLIIYQRVFDNDQMAWQVHTYCKCGGAADDIDVATKISLFDCYTVVEIDA